MSEPTKVLEELIQTRRTVHMYTKDRVPKSILLKAIQNSLWAPNHKLSFPWQFHIVLEPERAVIADLVINNKSQKSQPSEIKIKALRDKFENQGSLVLCCRKKFDEDDLLRAEEDRQTLACSIYIMSLILEAEGFCSKWSTGGYLRRPEFFSTMKYDADKIEVIGMLHCGKPLGAVPKAVERPSLDQVLF